MFKNMKIGTRLIMSIGFTVFIAIGIITIVIGLRVQALSEDDGSTIAEETARHYATTIQAELEVPLDEARATALIFEGFAVNKDITLTRRKANLLLKYMVEQRPDFLGVYVAFEPDAYDGYDENFIGEQGHDETGRFVPYWVRDGKGEGVMEALVDYEKTGAGDYYQIPKRNNREAILDPYIYAIQGEDVLLTSLTVPIQNAQDEFIGIAGVDLALDSLQTLIESIEISGFDDAYITFFSSDGTVVASQFKEEVGKKVREITDAAAYIDGIEGQKDFSMIRQSSALGEEVLTYGAAIEIGNTGTRWMVSVNIPTDELYAASRVLILLIAGIGIAAILILVAVIFFLARSISKPILLIVKGAERLSIGDIQMTGMNMKEIEKVSSRGDELGQIGQAFNKLIEYQRGKIAIAEEIADKNLRVEVSISSEQDSLGKAFQKMVDALNELLFQVNEAVEQVHNGSDQVSQASQNLSQGATEQASSLEEITSSTNEVNSQSKQNAENATEANGLAKQATADAQRGNEEMKRLKESMDKINASSDEINKVVKVIDDIAFQINLLALNANVEAARAGKYGKGFAVVADEVRNLAVKSTDSVKETTRMVEDTVANIRKGNEAAEATAEQLGSIVEGSGKVADFLEDIARASREQAEAIEQITEGLDQIDEATQASTAGAEESASASEELASQAQQLRSMVAQFSLADRFSGEPKQLSRGSHLDEPEYR